MIDPSPRKHGISDEATEHAVAHAIVWVEVGDDPVRVLLAGPDSAGSVLELVAMRGSEVVMAIHAMPLRRTTAEARCEGGA